MSNSVILCIHLTVVVLLPSVGFVPVSISRQDIRVVPDGVSSDLRCQQQLCFVLMGQEETASLRNKLRPWGASALKQNHTEHSERILQTLSGSVCSGFDRFEILSKQTAFFILQAYFCLWLQEQEKKSVPVMKWSYVSVMLWISDECRTVMISSTQAVK